MTIARRQSEQIREGIFMRLSALLAVGAALCGLVFVGAPSAVAQDSFEARLERVLLADCAKQAGCDPDGRGFDGYRPSAEYRRVVAEMVAASKQ